MRACPIQANAGFLCALALFGCGDAAVPGAPHDAATPVADAQPTPDDACVCNTEPVANRIGFKSYGTTFYGGNGNGTGCLADAYDQSSVIGELLGGGCVLEDGPNEWRARLTDIGPSWDDIFPPDGVPQRSYIGWGGFWQANARDEDHRIISTAACLLPAEESAACQRDLWISYQHETASIAAQSVHDLRVSCPEGVLVGGGCNVEPPNFDQDIRVLRAGFAPGDQDEWLCSWANNDEAEQYEVMSLAFCLHEEPLPAECGCCSSLADSIVVKQEDAPLRFGENRLEVRCDEGQLLVLGNCTLDVEDISTMAGVTMFRDGFPPTPEHPDGDHTRWGCSWYNPTGMTPRAIATAVCLPAQ